MLSALRSSSKSWVSKILLLLLVASFAIWGISDQITGRAGGNTVLTAGQTSVSTDEYRLAYDRAFRNLQAQFGPTLTREQAALFGIDSQVLSSLAAGAVLDEQARVMQLGLTKDGLAQVIAEDAVNWSSGGRFDRGLLQQVLRQIGMTEEDYVRTLESVAIRQQIVEAAAADMAVPDVLLDAVFDHRGESRDVSIIRIDPASIAAVEAPGDDVLEAYFNDNLASYRAPEFRKIRYVRLTVDELADPAAVAQSSVEAEYERTRDRFGQPERRTIQQLVFPDRTAAQQARERILAGETFEEAAKAQGRTLADTVLGEFAKADVPDPAIAEAAFALAGTNEISDVVDGAFGALLIQVSDIKPEAIAPLAEVEDQIRTDLARVEANEILLSVHDGYEDARGGGASLVDAAAQRNLDVVTIEAVDARGRDPEGNAVTGPEEMSDLLSEAFQAGVLEDNPPLAAGQGGFLWYEVVDVLPDRDRTYEEARERVLADWTAVQTAERLDEAAEALAARVSQSTDMAALASETSHAHDKIFGVGRNDTNPSLGDAGIRAVFSQGPDGVGTVQTPDGSGRIVYRVDQINRPLGNGSSLTEGDRNRIAATVADDILDQMVARAQSAFGVSVNRAAIDAVNATGGVGR